MIRSNLSWRTSTTIGLTLAVLLLSTAAPFASSAQTANKKNLVEQFKNSYADLKSVSLEFSSPFGNGTLQAVRGKGFRITMQDREIISNGTVVWNAQSNQKVVIINSVRGASQELSIERIFFALMHVYKPSVYDGEKGQSVIRLLPPDAESMIAGVDTAFVHVNNSMLVTRVNVVLGGSASTWDITSLKRNPAIKDELFAYTPPKGWHTVDLR